MRPLTVIYIAYALLAYGCAVSLNNFYLSFLQFPLYRLRGGNPDHFKSQSLVVLVGSLLIVAFLFSVAGSPWLFWAGVTCAVFDTGGPHWFALYMLLRRVDDEE